MNENKSVISGEFDRNDRYDAGLKSLAGSLRAAFIVLLLGIIGTLIYFFSGAGYFSVEPQEAVIVVRFGKVVATHDTGGHWYLPFPVNRFVRIQTSQQLLDVDFAPVANGADGGENSDLVPGRDSYLITGDENIVHTSWTVAYRVSNPRLYYETLLTPVQPMQNGKVTPDEVFTDANGMQSTRGPQTFLRNLFRNAVIEITAQSDVNILYQQTEYSQKVQRRFARMVADAKCGIQIDSVDLKRIYPPVRTKTAFDNVTAAGNIKDKMKQEAEKTRSKIINDAATLSNKIINDAQEYEKNMIAELEGQAKRFKDIFDAGKGYDGETVRMALFTDVLRKIAGKISGDKFILASPGGKKQLWLKLNPEPKQSAGKNGGQEEK